MTLQTIVNAIRARDNEIDMLPEFQELVYLAERESLLEARLDALEKRMTALEARLGIDVENLIGAIGNR